MKASLREKLKAEAARLTKQNEERGGSFTKVDWWRPKTGKNMVRILPIPGLDHVFKPIRQHLISVRKKDGSVVNNIPVRCGRDLHKTRDAAQGDCLLCDVWEKLLKVDREKAKQIRPIEKFLYLICDLETQEVLPFAAPSTVHQPIVEFATEFDESEDPFDLKIGRNWNIVKKVDPTKPKQFGTTYAARPSPNPSEFPAKLMPKLNAAPDFSNLFEDYDVVKVKEFLNTLKLDLISRNEEETQEETPVKKAKTKAKVVEEDDEEFEEIKPKAKKKVVVEEDDEEFEEIKPKAKKKVVVEDDFEDDDEESASPVKKKSKKVEEDDFDFESELEELGL